jgi:glycosyltransferase involved in cell wall biosynthesis
MKILHCIPGMGGGGAERQLAYLAGPLGACGWDVHVALETGGPNLPRLQAGGAAVHWLTGAGNHDPRLAWQLARIFLRLRPDLVQVWFIQMEVLAGAVSELLGVPWVISERSSRLAYPPSMKNRLRVAIARTADAIVSNSSAGDSYWDSRASRRVPRFVIPNALPFDEIDATSAAVPAGLPIGPADAVVLFAGRFGPEKNVERLLSALREIVRRPRTVAVLCGEGPLRAGLQRTIAADKLGDRILTPGYIADIWPLMKRADVMVATGLFEGRPNGVLEAMACNLPLVVSDIPAHREILDKRSAWWVDPADPPALTEAVLEILENPADARQRAAAARSRADGWSVPDVAAQYDRVYREVLKNCGASRTPIAPRPF